MPPVSHASKPPVGPSPRIRAYAAWIERWYRSILASSVVVAIIAGGIASTLPIHADFSYLLPPSATAVQHLRALEKRARILGTLMVAVTADDTTARQGAAETLRVALEALPQDLVSSVDIDQHVARQFAWKNRWLFASTEDLLAAKAALQTYSSAEHHLNNPLVADLDAPAKAPEDDGVSVLFKHLREAEKSLKDPGAYVSKDGKLQMLIVHTPFPAGDVDADSRLIAAVEKAVATLHQAYPTVKIGLAGDVVSSRAEQRAILTGMVSATVLTVVLVVLGLLLYYRSISGVSSLCWSLTVGTLLTFMFTRLGIGHLNLATAFLASIVVGNGINFGIILLARYVEAQRANSRGLDALTIAIGDTLTGTLAAALTACVAYLSLIVTDFRGFRDFGYIGGIGMLLCWCCSYTILPACMVWAQRLGRLKSMHEPHIGRILAKLLPQRLQLLVSSVLILVAICSGVAWQFLSHDPYEANFRNLRSDSAAILEERRWMHSIDSAFGQGISGGFVIGAPNREAARALDVRLRALDAGKSEHERLFSRINALDDALPKDQPQKLQILADIRNLMTDAVMQQLPPTTRRRVAKLKPPADLQPITDADIPAEIAWPFTEADGSRGKLILAMSGWGYEIWNAHDLIRFADTVRSLELGEQTLLGGSAFVFADMLRLVERDGPRATLAASLGAMAVIFSVVGWRLHGWVTLLCGASGTLLMLACVALLGLRVNFLDFVALPITIGIGIDYAANICARQKQTKESARQALVTTGGAVFMASYTTIVGYGSLLLSSNKGIRSFGTAAIIGEVTCLLTALVLAPALLECFQRDKTSAT